MSTCLRSTAGGLVFALGVWMQSADAAPLPASGPAAITDSSQGKEPASAQTGENRPMGAPGNPAAQPQKQPGGTEDDARTLPNLSKSAAWPEPVDDRVHYTYTLFDLLEYQRLRGDIDAFRWSTYGWRGGDVNRFWFKSEGSMYSSSRQGGEGDLQALFGRLISPYFDLQTGLRAETHIENASVTRVFAVIGLQGLAPYRFNIEPELFLSNKGKFSGRFTGSYDTLISQRWILQPRFETEFAFQKDEPFGVDPGITEAEIGLRLRYEARREFAPYVGVSFAQSFGATQYRIIREGGIPNQLQFVMGLRWWH